MELLLSNGAVCWHEAASPKHSATLESNQPILKLWEAVSRGWWVKCVVNRNPYTSKGTWS